MQADWKPDFQAAAFKVCKYIQSYGTTIIDSADFQTRRFGDVLWVTVLRIRASVQCINSFLRSSSKLWQGPGKVHSWCLPSYVLSASVAFRCVAFLKPVPQVGSSGMIKGFFSCADWRCVSFCCLSSVWVWYPAQNHLSDRYKTVGPRNTSPSGHHSQAVKRHSLYESPPPRAVARPQESFGWGMPMPLVRTGMSTEGGASPWLY